jgi:hypothetical protein
LLLGTEMCFHALRGTAKPRPEASCTAIYGDSPEANKCRLLVATSTHVQSASGSPGGTSGTMTSVNRRYCCP